VPRIVYTSTLAVYGYAPGRVLDELVEPRPALLLTEVERSRYRAHFEVALPLQQQGLPVVVACPGRAFGPGDPSRFARLLRLYARGRLPALVGPDTAENWTYAPDVAAGLRLAAERARPGETYFLAGPALTLRELFAAAERATGLPGPRLWLPSGLARVLAGALQGLRPGLAAALRAYSGGAFIARSEKAARDLGWQPRPIEAGLAATVHWVQAELAREKQAHDPTVEIEA
jgi:nucleoside-diphosphate-sugar epimerase